MVVDGNSHWIGWEISWFRWSEAWFAQLSLTRDTPRSPARCSCRWWGSRRDRVTSVECLVLPQGWLACHNPWQLAYPLNKGYFVDFCGLGSFFWEALICSSRCRKLSAISTKWISLVDVIPHDWDKVSTHSNHSADKKIQRCHLMTCCCLIAIDAGPWTFAICCRSPSSSHFRTVSRCMVPSRAPPREWDPPKMDGRWIWCFATLNT